MKPDYEFLRKLGQPEPLRSLRLQKERLDAERRRFFERIAADQEAELLRREIRKMGHEPCR
jgi:hypothetical protein